MTRRSEERVRAMRSDNVSTYESEALEALRSVDLSEAIGDAAVHAGVSLYARSARLDSG